MNLSLFLSHFPISQFNFGRSSALEKQFYNLITNTRPILYLSGHLHPSQKLISHHNNLIEFVGIDLRNHHSFALLTFDNGNRVYHIIDTENPVRTFVTSPAPVDQLSLEHVFNNGKIGLRFIIF